MIATGPRMPKNLAQHEVAAADRLAEEQISVAVRPSISSASDVLAVQSERMIDSNITSVNALSSGIFVSHTPSVK